MTDKLGRKLENIVGVGSGDSTRYFTTLGDLPAKFCKLDLTNLMEQLQEDLSCVLDGMDSDTVGAVCEVVVKRIKELRDRQ